MTAIKGINQDNLGILFTFCDSIDMKKITIDKVPAYEGWTKALTKTINDLEIKINPNNYFFFSAEKGKMGEATT